MQRTSITGDGAVRVDTPERLTRVEKLVQSKAESVRPERRQSERYELHWPVSIAIGAGSWVDCVTSNLCSRGFFCVSPNPLPPGTETDSRISMPTASRRENRWIQLLCRIRVVRIQGLAEGYGLGCVIEDYMIVADGR